ncbi:helix-turn-helix domain-containing protein [Ureibacillus sinduriensis]|uniref:HTH cro/C1-type domain-containing protein n=1 Tax=Ureibacillus sinduriensis BLB-1 = JCM 15800 TaxID=1384057 RepID=A0A0A3HSB2_9BACL|nr:Rgg/GadR/MutR family transcriptional regulator [Ureibacillus sinduriensis]KGR75269.1 hypothetical protein CD33_11130 [Ureibacillus sinduriensis BLB-1 = JCM 15800]
MQIGTVIKEIRMSKNIPSNKVYRNILTRPAIAKFEKGLSDTSVEKFFLILEALNITLEEFEVLYYKAENKDFQYTKQYAEAYYNKNIDELRKIAQGAKKDFEFTGNVKYRHYQAIVLLLIDQLKDNHENENEQVIIRDYLMGCNTWGYYEITLFTNTIAFHSLELIDSVYSRAINTLLLLKNLKRYRNEIALMLFNILEKTIIVKDTLRAKFYLVELKKIKNDVLDNMYIQAMIKYFSAIVEMIDGQDRNEVIMKIISTFNFLELSSKEDQCYTFYHKVKKLYQL